MKVFKIEIAIFLILLLGAIVFQLAKSLTSELQGSPQAAEDTHIIVLGIAQDAGYPQINCQKSCCQNLWTDKRKRKMVSSIALRDPQSKRAWLFDATPDFKDQLQLLKEGGYTLEGIFLTHAHIGHYTGLMQLGLEALVAENIPVYVLPRMKEYLENNGPWSQLVSLKNIELRLINDSIPVSLSPGVSVETELVPHRDEFSETAAFTIRTNTSSALFIPDIDKWNKWDKDINVKVQNVDLAFLDGSFYRNGEIWGRDMSLIPHPFITESMIQFSTLSAENKNKIHFIHLNHTNPLLNTSSSERKEFDKTEFKLAQEKGIYKI